MAGKQKKVENELQGGSLSHNPFAALRAAGQQSSGGAAPNPIESAPCMASPKAGQQRIVVRFEAKGHGGKTITRISGLALGPQELKVLASRLKQAMGTGARVEDDEILVQGQLVQRVMKWLPTQGHRHVVRGN